MDRSHLYPGGVQAALIAQLLAGECARFDQIDPATYRTPSAFIRIFRARSLKTASRAGASHTFDPPHERAGRVVIGCRRGARRGHDEQQASDRSSVTLRHEHDIMFTSTFFVFALLLCIHGCPTIDPIDRQSGHLVQSGFSHPIFHQHPTPTPTTPPAPVAPPPPGPSSGAAFAVP